MGMSQPGRKGCEARITENRKTRASQWEKSSGLHRKSEKNKEKTSVKSSCAVRKRALPKPV